LEGDNLQLNTIELRYPIIPLQAVKFDFIPFERFQIFQYGMFLTAFLDAGNVWYNSRSTGFGLRQVQYDFNKNKYGYGVGIVMVGGYEATARLDFAFNQQGRFQIVIENEISF
jgi:outer membrane protein assembly factor BamA